MVALLVILSIAALIALDYFVLRKRRVGREMIENIEVPGLTPLSDLVRQLRSLQAEISVVSYLQTPIAA